MRGGGETNIGEEDVNTMGGEEAVKGQNGGEFRVTGTEEENAGLGRRLFLCRHGGEAAIIRVSMERKTMPNGKDSNGIGIECQTRVLRYQ